MFIHGEGYVKKSTHRHSAAICTRSPGWEISRDMFYELVLRVLGAPVRGNYLELGKT